MKFRFDLYTRINQVIIDGIIIATSFAVSYWIRFEGVPPWVYVKQYLIWLPYLVAFRLVVNWKLGIYRFIWRYVSLSDAIAITRSLAIVTGFVFAVRLLYPSHILLAPRFKIPMTVIALEFFITLGGCLVARVLRRLLYQRRARKDLAITPGKKVVLVGAGRAGLAVAQACAIRPEIQLVGFLDDDPKKIGSVIDGLRVLGSAETLPAVVHQYEVDEVVICIPRAPRDTLKRLWALADHSNVPIKIVPTFEELMHSKVGIAAFREVQMSDLLGRESFEHPKDSPDVSPTYIGRRILITGAGGSIGSELSTQLIELGPRKLVLLDKDENGLNDIYVRLASSAGSDVVDPVVADIRFPDRLRAIFERFRPEIVFHAAAHKHVPLMEMNPCEAILNNVMGTRNLVELSNEYGVSRFVFVSTDKAVKPVSVMGASKRVCEMVIQAHAGNGATKFACVRFGNVMGSRGSVIPLFQQQIARGGPITVTHPEMRRFLMTIPEAVRLVLQAATLGTRGEIFVLDMGDPVRILDLARDLVELSGLRLGHDIQVETTQLRPGEKLVEELVDSTIEKLVPTPYEKIRVIRSCPFDVGEFSRLLAKLEDAARCELSSLVLDTLRKLDFGFNPTTTCGRDEMHSLVQSESTET